MAVTFSITNSPEKVSESECLCVYDGEADEHCPYCNGTGMSEDREPAWPWTNLSNVNARNVLGVLGFVCGQELYGVWEGEGLDVAIRRCLRALNVEKARRPALREPVEEGRFHEMGYSDERVQLRVREILLVCRKAKEEGEKVVWG